jgi:hypothetical protein
MRNIVVVAVMSLTFLLGTLSADDKPAPPKPVPASSKPVQPTAKPAPPPSKPPTPTTDEDAVKRRERMQQRDKEIDRVLKEKSKR